VCVVFYVCLKYCADTWELAWGRESSYGPTPRDWVMGADKLVSGGVSLLDGAHPARPPAINDR